MRLLYYNEIDKETISAQSEASGYPVENVQDYQLVKKYRSATIATLIDRGDCESATAPMVTGETVPLLSNTTFAQDATVYHAGSYSYKITKTVATGTAAYADIVDAESTTDMHGLSAANTYTFTAWVYVPSASGIALNEVALEFADYTTAWETSTSANPTAFDTWQQLTVTRSVRASATGMVLRVFNNATTDTDEYFYIDDLALYAWEWITIDGGTGSTITATSAALVTHNLTSGCTVKVQGNATEDWNSPSVDETMTYSSGIMAAYFTSATYRYWRIAIYDISNTYIEIGRAFIGIYLQMSFQPKAAFPLQYIDTSTKKYSLKGQVFGDEGIIYKIYNFLFPYWDDTERKNIATVFNEVKTIKPVILIPDENNTDKLIPVYAVINDNVSLNHLIAYTWNGTISLKEVF